MSHSFMVTLPLVTLRILNPTVGIESSINCPDYMDIQYHDLLFVYICVYTFKLTAITFTRVVLPLFCKPTKVNSISVYIFILYYFYKEIPQMFCIYIMYCFDLKIIFKSYFFLFTLKNKLLNQSNIDCNS